MSEDFDREGDLQFFAQPYLFEPEYTDDEHSTSESRLLCQQHQMYALFLFSLCTKSILVAS